MLQLPLEIERNRQSTLQFQLFEQIRRFILAGQLKPGMMLPSSRALAENLGISRHTVMLAYERLFAEGYLETKAAARTMVSRGISDLGRSPARSRPQTGEDALAIPAPPALYPAVFKSTKMRVVCG